MVIERQEIVGYEKCLEPNQEMYCSEFTDYPTTRDRQYIIVEKPVCGAVSRTVLDLTRASGAAETLVALIIADERYIYLAEEPMRDRAAFSKYWEHLCLHCKDKKTIGIALRHVGRAPSQLFVKKLGKTPAKLKSPSGVCREVFCGCLRVRYDHLFYPAELKIGPPDRQDHKEYSRRIEKNTKTENGTGKVRQTPAESSHGAVSHDIIHGILADFGHGGARGLPACDSFH
jgi:hypothetical protein